MNQWQVYTGEYEKKWYDIKMNNGIIIKDCWPNAGMFHSEDSDYIPSQNVAYIRETDDPIWRAVDARQAKQKESDLKNFETN